MEEVNRIQRLTLVVRKEGFGLPTACPACLPAYIYLKFAQVPFDVAYNHTYPDSDQIPYIESGTYVAFNNEKGGVIESLKEDGVINLDSEVNTRPEWISMKAMVDSSIADAIMYELWLGLDIYKRAAIAYGALSTWLGEESFLFENRPTSLDAVFLAQALFTIHVLPETSVLRGKLLDHDNLVRYATNHKRDFVDSGLPSSVPPYQSDPSSSTPRQGASSWNSKPKSKPKREKTQQEKALRRRAKYFLVTQLVAVLVFLTLFGGSDDAEVEVGGDEDSSFDD